MALTKKETVLLEGILGDLQTAHKYLMKDSTLICSDILPHALSFYNKEGKGITPMNKHVGSDLVRLLAAINRLRNLINPDKE